jgi:hypothetical protein
MEVREKSRRGLRPAGFSVDWVLCELTRRAGLLWPWRGDRRGSNGGRFEGGSSLPGLRLSGRGGRCRPVAGAGPALACCPGELGRPGAGQGRGRWGAPVCRGVAACQADRRRKKGRKKKGKKKTKKREKKKKKRERKIEKRKIREEK